MTNNENNLIKSCNNKEYKNLNKSIKFHKHILIIYESEIDKNKYIFDITNYINYHPGEGIRGIYLKHFKILHKKKFKTVKISTFKVVIKLQYQ